MNSILQKSISFPISNIKQPGSLMKQTKSLEIPSSISNLSSSSLFNFTDAFSFSLEDVIGSYTEESLDKTLINKPKCKSADPSPGKLKKSSDEMALLIQKAREVFSKYELWLVFEDFRNSRHAMYLLLKALVSEICLFPVSFFKDIKLKHLVICYENPANKLEPKSSEYFSLCELDTKQKVCFKLHKLILNHIIQENPCLLRNWRVIQSCSRNSGIETPKGLEETFLDLMQRYDVTSLKYEAIRLRKLLEQYYPDAMSEETFVRRSQGSICLER